MSTPLNNQVAPRNRGAIFIWLLAVLIGMGILLRTTFSADLTAFLPRNPTQEQQLLVEQLRDGMVSRMILMGIEGADPKARATLSRTLANGLRKDKQFLSVNNGEPVHQKADHAYLFNNRYLLSPAVSESHFSVEGLHAAFSETIDLLTSPAGLLIKDILPQDPSGEMAALFALFNSDRQPKKQHGVWVAGDGSRALLLAQTQATGSDTDAQEAAITTLRNQFEDAKANLARTYPQAVDTQLLLTGPGVFGVNARNTITQEATLFSLISASLIMSLLFFAYRSCTAVFLGLIPVISGIVAGTVAVSLGFGMVHAITLGFGTTMIGEAIDYAIYLFIQSGNAHNSTAWARTAWPTIRLGVLTSMSGFGALLFSSFPGLSQIGLYTIAGLVCAVFVTRYVLPSLLPRDFVVRDLSHIGRVMQRAMDVAHTVRWLFWLIFILAGTTLWIHHHTLWQTELGALSPVSKEAQALDEKLRQDIGAPDVRYLVVVKGKTLEDALQAAEKVVPRLDDLVEKGQLVAYESPTRYLPSQATQRRRLASLPTASQLQERVNQAVQHLPLQASVLTPFIAAIEKEARLGTQTEAEITQRLLTRQHLAGTSMAMAINALLIEQDDDVTVLMPLTTRQDGIHVNHMRDELMHAGVQRAYFIDLKAETDKLYRSYMQEAIVLALCGMLAMSMMLGWSMKSFAGLVRVMLPLAAAVLSVSAFFAATGERMSILHLVGLLLTVAVGSNYALFFAQSHKEGQANASAIAPTTLASLVFANLTTVIGFGVLGFSSVPVLSAIGKTVGIGVALALLYAAVFSGPHFLRRIAHE